jgi:hypothetical protein
VARLSKNYLVGEIFVLRSASCKFFEVGLRLPVLQLRSAIFSRLAASAFRRASFFGSVNTLIEGSRFVSANGPPRHSGRRHGRFNIISIILPSHGRTSPEQYSLRIAAIPPA